MKVDIKEGLIFAIYDHIAERLVSVFYARNEADAQRYVKANFLKAEPVVREGLVLTILLDIDFYRSQNPGMFDAKTIEDVLGPPLQINPALGKQIDMEELRTHVLGANPDLTKRSKDNGE